MWRRSYATVQWRKWTPSAFKEAANQNKPVFVNSISHSQWCGHMLNEAFASPAVANTLNSNYIPIQIHKDEQRGIDKALMMFLQLKANGQGGWPLNAVLTPTRNQPFIAASYLSETDLTKFLSAGVEVWSAKPEMCEKVGEEATAELESIRDGDHGQASQIDLSDAIEQARLQYKSLAEQSPRFVMGYALSVLGGDLRSQVLHSMANSGIVDHLEGGVYAYSISSDWHFPSFQKTLSGQATLLMACASQLRDGTDVVVYDLAQSLVRYIQKLSPHTSANCAGDAWTYHEFMQALSELSLLERDIAQMVWGVNENGNINEELDPLGTYKTQNVLSRYNSNDKVASTFGVSAGKVEEVFNISKDLLRTYKQHNKPQVEVNNRVATSDLGLALSGISQISPFVPEAQQLATNLATNLATKLDDTRNNQQCDDYAYTVMGLLDYHQHVDSDRKWVETAEAWQTQQLARFHDGGNAGFFYSEAEPNLYFRPKYTYDGAEPNYNGVSAQNLKRLGSLGFEHAEAADTMNVGVHGVLSSPLAHLSFLHQ